MSATHNMYIGQPCFPVFNDRELSMEPITDADVVPFVRSDSLDMNFAASASWSSDCEWYFVVLPEGIALFNVYDRRGLLCTKHSAMFIEASIDSGVMSKSLARRTRR